MASKRQRGPGSQRSCPNSAHRINQTPIKGYNPEFQQLSSKSLTLPSRPTGETHAPTPDSIRAALLHALDGYFKGQFSDFEGVCRGWVLREWKDTRLNLQNRLSKINYLSPTLIFESFGTVQHEIRLEWKKSHLLKGLTYLWVHSFRKRNFGTLQEAKVFYEGFCHTFTIVTYALFGLCFAAFEEKGIDVGGKLLRNTAVGFVTELKEWREIYCNKLQPLLLCECTPFSENFHVGSIEMNPRVLDVKSPCHNFPQTANNLSSLIQSLNLDEATAHLHSFRGSLLKQIEESINSTSKGGKQPTVQKDDVLGCIMYILVTHQLDGIGSFLAYLSFLLGKEIDSVLRSRKVDCFRADLEAAYWIVSQPIVKIDYSSIKTQGNGSVIDSDKCLEKTGLNLEPLTQGCLLIFNDVIISYELQRINSHVLSFQIMCCLHQKSWLISRRSFITLFNQIRNLQLYFYRLFIEFIILIQEVSNVSQECSKI